MAIKVEPEVWYSADEVAEAMGVSKKTLDLERSRGNGAPFSKIGRRVYYKGADLMALMEKRRRASTSAPAPEDRPRGGA